MTSAIGHLYDSFWDDSIWLVENVTWKSVERFRLSTISHQVFGFFAVSLVVRYFILYKLIFGPIGRYYGLKDKKIRLKANPILEGFYKNSKKPSHKDIVTLSEETQLAERAIQQWFRRRRNRDIPSRLLKFKEAGFRFVAYSFFLFYGLTIAVKYDWVWDTKEIWIGYPYQELPDHIVRYCAWIMGLYMHYVFTQFFDVKRKDFWQMFIHHIATLILVSGSYQTGHFRVSVAILLVHDAADPFLELAKLFNYLKMERRSEISFAILVLMWTYTRMYLLPVKLVPSALFESVEMGACTVMIIVLLGPFLILLQILQVFWYYLILKAAVNAFSSGVRDLRSSSESSDVEVQQRQQEKNEGVANGVTLVAAQEEEEEVDEYNNRDASDDHFLTAGVEEEEEFEYGVGVGGSKIAGVRHIKQGSNGVSHIHSCLLPPSQPSSGSSPLRLTSSSSRGHLTTSSLGSAAAIETSMFHNRHYRHNSDQTLLLFQQTQ